MDEQRALFGVELRRRRMQAGLSLAELARRVHYTKGYLSKVETGSKAASAALARLCDVEVGADGTLAALVSPRPGRDPARGRAGGGDQVWLLHLSPDGASRFTPLDRREALAADRGSLLGMATSPPRPRHAIDHRSVVASLADAFGRIRHVGQQTGPGVVLPLVIAHGHAVRTLARSGPTANHDALVKLGARCAEYAGWLAQECGDTDGALWWTDNAVRIADEAGDPDMAANALARRALIALYRSDALETIALARRAQTHHQVSTRIRGLAALHEAQGHALAGHQAACEQALERGTTLLADDDTGRDARDLALGPISVPDIAALVRGWCYHDLGQPIKAIEVLEPEIGRIPGTSRRAYARFATRLALAYAAAGEVEQACFQTDRVTDAAAAADSATIRADLSHLARALTRWPTHEQARATRLCLTELLYEAPI